MQSVLQLQTLSLKYILWKPSSKRGNISLHQDKTWMSCTLLEWLQNHLHADTICKCPLFTAKIKSPLHNALTQHSTGIQLSSTGPWPPKWQHTTLCLLWTSNTEVFAFLWFSWKLKTILYTEVLPLIQAGLLVSINSSTWVQTGKEGQVLTDQLIQLNTEDLV